MDYLGDAWMLFSGVMGGYLLRSGESVVESQLAQGLAVLGCLTGVWLTAMALPYFGQWLASGRIDRDAVGGTLMSLSFLAGMGGGYAWGFISPSRKDSP